MAGPLPIPTPSPSPSFKYLQHSAPGTQPVPSPSNSNTPIPVPTQTPPPSPPRQEVLYVDPNGSSRLGHWPPEPHLSDSNTKGKRPMDRPNVDASLRRRGLADGSSDASDSLLSPQVLPRQAGTDYPSCDDVGNYILSCYPTSGTTINQGEWTKFIWNTNIPEFIGLPGQVDIYQYHADSGALVQSWLGINNVQGQINVVANDSFWDYRMSKWQPGQTIPYTYYFVIVKAGTQLTGGEERQATWTAVQTALADSVYASSSSAASVSSVSMESYLSALGPTSASLISVSMSRASASAFATGTSGAGLQGAGEGDNNGGFPAWAIALLVILGFLAFLSMAGLGYVLIRNWRRKHRRGSGFSVDSASPMMVQTGGPMSDDVGQSPVTLQSPDHFAKSGPLAAAGAVMGAVAAAPGGTRNNSVQYDGASTRSVSDAGLFSGQDAAIMADAFRKALRKPDFADRPLEEGESPDTGTNGVKNTPSSGAAMPSPAKPQPPPPPPQVPEPDVISRELAEEGRDLRSVSSVRGVTVQSLDDGSAEGTTTTGTNRKPS